MKNKLMLFALYLASSFMDAGFINAKLEHERGSGRCDSYREDLAFAVGWSLFPVAPVILTPFLTGFWEHGWRLSPPPECQNKESR